jgi:hypothetical protein
MWQILPAQRETQEMEMLNKLKSDGISGLRTFALCVDVGFVLYWGVVWLSLVPDEFMFKDYRNPILHDWNYSFLPLDVIISVTGFSALWLKRKGGPLWCGMMLISMALTFCSGLQAVAFWALRDDFDVAWWVPNLILLLGPLYFMPKLLMLLCVEDPERSRGQTDTSWRIAVNRKEFSADITADHLPLPVPYSRLM